MTLDIMRKEVWRQIGEPPDLDPSTDISYGGLPTLNWVLNEAQRQIAVWKDPIKGSVIRHPQLYGEMFFQTVVRSFTLTSQAGSTTSTIILPTGASTSDGAYVGWLIQSGSEVKVVVGYVGSTLTATIMGTWVTQPLSAGTVKLFKRFMMFGKGTELWISDHILLPSSATNMRTEGNLLDILKIEDLDQQLELSRASRTESYIGQTTQTGDPTSYFRRGNRIIFDVASSTAKWYRMEYLRLPTDMSGTSPTTETPELPEQYHYPITLWAIEWGFRQSQDYIAARATQMMIDDSMRKIISLDDMTNDRRSDRGRLRRN
jgi:hypothetical protein